MIPLPSLGLGTADLGNLRRARTDDEAAAILETAWAAGVRYFDTAPHYGLGLAERRLGDFLATKPREQFVVSTKAGRRLHPVANPERRLDTEGFAVPADLERSWEPGLDGIRRGLDESLDRLRLDRVDLLLLHDPERYDLDAADAAGYPALRRLRDEGLVGAVGLGSMSVPALDRAVRTPGLDVLMVAGRLTLADASAAEVAELTDAAGVRIIAAGVFNSGLLAEPVVSAGAQFDYAAASPELVERARALAAICVAHGVELPAAALRYPLRFPAVGTVVIGAAEPTQVEIAVTRMAADIPDELWAALRAAGLLPVAN
jgi:D-threo-aldose 1-dehydrogenase